MRVLQIADSFRNARLSLAPNLDGLIVMLPKPNDIFDLPYLRVASGGSINRMLAPSIEKAFTRTRSTRQRQIDDLDGLILSQYVRLFALTNVVVLTANLDMLSWACAGVERPPTAQFDRRIEFLLKGSGIEFSGNCVVDREADQLGAVNIQQSIILADRADIIEFSDTLLKYITSGQSQILIIHDVIDTISRDLYTVILKSGVNACLLPGYRSFIVCETGEDGACQRLARAI